VVGTGWVHGAVGCRSDGHWRVGAPGRARCDSVSTGGNRKERASRGWTLVHMLVVRPVGGGAPRRQLIGRRCGQVAGGRREGGTQRVAGLPQGAHG
jgi:hypothetical protein